MMTEWEAWYYLATMMESDDFICLSLDQLEHDGEISSEVRESCRRRMNRFRPRGVHVLDSWWGYGSPLRFEFCWKMAEQCESEGLA